MKLKSYNEGGSTAPLATPVPTGAPGSATAAIEAYLGGTSTGSPTINYTPGDPYKAKLLVLLPLIILPVIHTKLN